MSQNKSQKNMFKRRRSNQKNYSNFFGSKKESEKENTWSRGAKINQSVIQPEESCKNVTRFKNNIEYLSYLSNMPILTDSDGEPDYSDPCVRYLLTGSYYRSYEDDDYD